MERDKAKGNDQELGSGERHGTRPNGRDKTSLVINRNGARKDLFLAKPIKENLPSGIRPTKASIARAQSMSVSPDQKPTSKGSLSRPQAAKTSFPKPLSLKEAYRMVPDDDDAGPGSPSPAPRPWRKTGAVATKTVKSPTPGQGRGNGQVVTRRPGHTLRHSVDSLGHGSSTSPASPNSHGAYSHHGDQSDSDFEERMKQFGISQESNGGRQDEKESGNGNGNQDELSSPVRYRPWGVKAASTNGWLKHAMSSPTKNDLDDRSGFDMDEDFTAGDLQVSNSPPLKFGSGIAAIRQNTKLDEIRALEHAADLQYMSEPPEPLAAESPEENGVNNNGALPLVRTNTKIDEIRAREEEASSRRAIAKAKLDEIREHNAEARRSSLSPESRRKLHNEPPKLAESPMPDDRPRRLFNTTIQEEVGERIPDTPITVYRRIDIVDSVQPTDRAGTGILDGRGALQDHGRKPLLREESLDAIRRLARATSSSPAPEPEQHVIQSDVEGGAQGAAAVTDKAKETEEKVERDVSPRSSRRDRNDEKPSDLPKKKVGFAFYQRDPSTSSEKSSRSARSDMDPTDRIERELQLFAPGENHSEGGSRAPTPYSDVDDVEETPRPTRVDPLTQPTPKVTGAYVETPATVKFERIEVTAGPVIREPQPEMEADVDQVIRSRRPEISSRNPTQSSSVEGIRNAKRKERLESGPGAHRRARSLGRSGSPLINSLQPPSVKDDLREIRRFHQFEDSTVDVTLDNFGGVLANQDTQPSHKTRESTSKQEKDEERSEDQHLDTQDILAHQKQKVDRALVDTRIVKKGMDRLWDTVETGQRMKLDEKLSNSKPDKMPEAAAQEPPTTKPKEKASDSIPHVQSSPDTGNIEWVRLPIPILYRKAPKFKLTWLGVLFCLLSLYPIWYVAESTMCHFYCKPQYCYPGKPCVWSYDDPFWGYAIPVKLDQWTTGGVGRSLVRKARPEVEDWIADVWDAATGTDIKDVDTRYFSYDQRKKHRRRLMKRGLIKPLVETEEDKKVYAAWAAARKARERVIAMREMGYDVQEEESMTADEKVR